MSIVLLNNLLAGQHAIISRVTGLPEDVHRLEEFGFIKGRGVVMVQPSKTMCIVKMGSSKVCVRTNDKVHILVSVIGELK